ncbi:hypothetical protein ABG768_003369 [Culter alburnus]|uniref:Rho-GAP domain-containing protein n=1 Tax=Culter alburnus TaxID=194366 RepID=A0AAW2A1B1_CULAL
METQRAAFGVPLIGLRRSGQMRQGLPLVLMHIVEFVEKHGLRESGLFRVGGKVKHCQELRKSFDQGGVPEFDSEDIPTLASLLKLFLRELPGGLIPEPHRTQLLNVFRDSKEEEMNQALRTILNSLPEEHFNVLCYLLFFLSRVAAESHLNLMTSKNLSIVLDPPSFSNVPLSPTMVEEQGLILTLYHAIATLCIRILTLYHAINSDFISRYCDFIYQNSDFITCNCEFIQNSEIKSRNLFFFSGFFFLWRKRASIV